MKTNNKINFGRVDPNLLAKFDESTKKCVMNCGPTSSDKRSHKERKFLCSDCLIAEKKESNSIGNNLSEYKNITDWALRVYYTKPENSIAGSKDAALCELNLLFDTNYQRKHIDNWHAERKDVPKKVLEYWREKMIELEIETIYPELGQQINRLFKR